MSTVEQAHKLWAQVNEFQLNGIEFVERFSIEQMAEDYNGIGAEWMHPLVREALDALHPDLRPCAFVHDIEWAHSDGTEEFFHTSNRRFRFNARKIAEEKYGWWRLRRYLLIHQGDLFFRLLEDFGRKAYSDAYVKRTTEAAR